MKVAQVCGLPCGDQRIQIQVDLNCSLGNVGYKIKDELVIFPNLIPIGCDTQRSDDLRFKETSQWFCIK